MCAPLATRLAEQAERYALLSEPETEETAPAPPQETRPPKRKRTESKEADTRMVWRKSTSMCAPLATRLAQQAERYALLSESETEEPQPAPGRKETSRKRKHQEAEDAAAEAEADKENQQKGRSENGQIPMSGPSHLPARSLTKPKRKAATHAKATKTSKTASK